MLESCGKHPHEMGVALCRRCGGSWCETCIVHPFGEKKPPYCMSCAMVAGGVRTSAALPAMPRKALKAQLKALRAEAKAAAKADATTEVPAPAQVDVALPASESVEAHSSTDWVTPWWEDRQATAMAD